MAPGDDSAEFSDLYVTGQLIKRLPDNSKLILANSLTVRNAQFFNLDSSISVYCNRGVNGLEGTLAGAIGFASVCKDPVYLIIGDLSFFYGLNALWRIEHIKNLRILLINNKGGGIFRSITGLDKMGDIHQFITVQHDTDVQKWIEATSVKYLQAKNRRQLSKNLDVLMNKRIETSMCLEVITDIKK